MGASARGRASHKIPDPLWERHPRRDCSPTAIGPRAGLPQGIPHRASPCPESATHRAHSPATHPVRPIQSWAFGGQAHRQGDQHQRQQQDKPGASACDQIKQSFHPKTIITPGCKVRKRAASQLGSGIWPPTNSCRTLQNRLQADIHRQQLQPMAQGRGCNQRIW